MNRPGGDSTSDGAARTDPASVALGFEGLRARPGDHIGHFFETDDQWMEVALGFLTTGVRSGHRCMYVIEDGGRRRRLQEALLAADVELDSDQIHFHGGLGEPDALRTLLSDFVAEAEESGAFVRWGGEMGWALQEMADDRALMEWESACNVVEDPPVVFLCQYEIGRFPGSTIFNALRTHPLCIVGGAIHRNPFFEDPEAVLQELDARRDRSD